MKTVEHTSFDLGNYIDFTGKSTRRKRTAGFRGTPNPERLADQIMTENQLRLLEPASLPKVRRGWDPRPRPQTAIIALAAQRKLSKVAS